MTITTIIILALEIMKTKVTVTMVVIRVERCNNMTDYKCFPVL